MTTFTFATDGIESASDQTRAAAGDENMAVAGGANVASSSWKSGCSTSSSPRRSAPPGRETRLFDHLGPDQLDLEVIRAVESEAVTHLKYRGGQ